MFFGHLVVIDLINSDQIFIVNLNHYNKQLMILIVSVIQFNWFLINFFLHFSQCVCRQTGDDIVDDTLSRSADYQFRPTVMTVYVHMITINRL